MDGVILVDKPAGMTSFSLASKVRRLTGAKKSGHAGTLDPLATGVMAILLGSATKLSEYLSSEDKRYTATVKFGISTDSMDSDGEIVSQRECNFTKEDLLIAIEKFKGDITQIPPKYSAIKVNGRKLYSYARNGEEVEIPSREVHIFRFDLVSFDAEKYEAVVDVLCSKGTYIRSLANDLGEELGCGAHLTALRRTQSGDFSIENCVTLAELESDRDKAAEKVISCEDVISFMKRIDIKNEGLKSLRNGNPIDLSLAEGEPSAEEELVRLFCEDEFYAVGKRTENVYKIVKMIKAVS
ncbi:MAG: tRNA pseudouridine(55) synthase TruB [Anaerofustis stercorihominis]|nr:tRNA pseudouridine(55) synthase TruB [Anaerofustis stercorihominis]